MKSNTTIALVLLVIIAVGYFFWKKKKDAAKENENKVSEADTSSIAPSLPVGTRPLKSTEMSSTIKLVEPPHKLGGLRAEPAAQYLEPKSPLDVVVRGGETRVLVNTNGGMVNTNVNPNQFPTSIVNPTKMPTIPGTKVGSIVFGNGLGFTAQPHFAQSVQNILANIHGGNPIVSNSMVANAGGRG